MVIQVEGHGKDHRDTRVKRPLTLFFSLPKTEDEVDDPDEDPSDGTPRNVAVDVQFEFANFTCRKWSSR